MIWVPQFRKISAVRRGRKSGLCSGKAAQILWECVPQGIGNYNLYFLPLAGLVGREQGVRLRASSVACGGRLRQSLAHPPPTALLECFLRQASPF